jgi:16S rRNA (guanine966-N2)-methyltransferase
MRIISGTHGGRRINPPSHMPLTRPTTDIAKEGLFNILQNSLDFENLIALDLFGGTGSISYELASRGCTQQTIVEQDDKMYAFIKKTIATFHFDHIQVMRMEVFRFLQTCTERYDFIFAGPPYALASIDDIPNIICEKKLLTDTGVFVLEHTPRNNYELHPCFVKMKNYGTTVFSFFSLPNVV